MISENENTGTLDASEALIENVKSACAKVPPLWPLKNFVAVNPFVGLSHTDFAAACRIIHKAAHAEMTLPAAAYARAFADHQITTEDLAEASHRDGASWTPKALINALSDPWEGESPTLTVADHLDRKHGTRWNTLIIDEVSKWSAAYYDQGQALWRMPWRHLPLFRAWKHAAELDRTPEVSGLIGFRRSVKSLPDDALLAIQIILSRLAIPADQSDPFLHRQLMSLRGWAGYIQYLVREKSMRGTRDDSLEQFLAIRLAYDFALAEAFVSGTGVTFHKPEAPPQKTPALAVWQDALEISERRKFVKQLKPASTPAAASPARPDFQAIFCIDVRSEIFRRALEQAAPKSETIGFAGFFGFPIEVVPLAKDHGTARCPVLLLPSHQVEEAAPTGNPASERDYRAHLRNKNAAAGAWKTFKTGAVSCFPFVESAGLAFAASLVRDTLALPKHDVQHTCGYHLEPCSHGSETGIPTGDRVALAEGALKNMGLSANFARIVLICGHGSQTANNPFGSSLDCGACGGHAGDANARVAAMVLNEPAVRSALATKGIAIPEDTIFLAGLHNTTGDVVELFDADHLPASHRADLKALVGALKAAGSTARAERAPALGLKVTTTNELKASIERRMRDWSEVRPEWGLAGNHAFIAAPRERTSHLRLDGRAFLHNYRHEADPEDKILELIMCAPMVVASWINLQYFASSANNAAFGSGNKVLHNVVGRIGVLEGNSGDLRTGLPWQSVHTGTASAHTPLRLNVIIEAPRERIDNILAKHEGVLNLVQNRWIHLHSLVDQSLFHREPAGSWNRVF